MSKIRYEEKVKAIKEIESGEKSITGIAKERKEAHIREVTSIGI